MSAFMRGYRIFVSVVSVVAIVLVFLIAGVRLFGITPYTVLSGSMEPKYHVGAVIYVKEADAKTLKVNDPITFKLNDLVVTHRIIEIKNDEKGLRFYTKGDANNTADGGYVVPRDVIGVPLFQIPLLGYVFNFIQNPPGLYIVSGSVLLLVVLSFLQVDEDEEESTEEKETPVV